MVFQLIVVIPFSALVVLQSFTVDSCYGSQTCDYALATATQFITPIAAVCILLVTIPVTIVLARHGRSVIAAPLCGLILVVLIGILAVILNNESFTIGG